MWHPLRLAEDFATADILTGGRVVFGVGRGYHTREVETFGAPMLDAEANRELFEEQVEIIFKAFNAGVLLAPGQALHAAARGALPRLRAAARSPWCRGPMHLPVECWQPIVSASAARRSTSWCKHGIKGVIGGGRARRWPRSSIHAYREARARAGRDSSSARASASGSSSTWPSRASRAIREITPWYEEHVKMFAPLGFVPGITPAQIEASSTGAAAGARPACPTVEHYMKVGAWFAGPPEELVAYLKDRSRSGSPACEYVH